MWSAIPLRLADAGFQFSRQQLFWLTATPVLLGSFLRIPYGLLVSTFGSRPSYAAVTLLLLLPWAYTGMALFALLCLFVNGWFYQRRNSPTRC